MTFLHLPFLTWFRYNAFLVELHWLLGQLTVNCCALWSLGGCVTHSQAQSIHKAMIWGLKEDII